MKHPSKLYSPILMAAALLLTSMVSSAGFEAQSPRITPKDSVRSNPSDQPQSTREGPSSRTTSASGENANSAHQAQNPAQQVLSFSDRQLIQSLSDEAFERHLINQLGSGLTPERMEQLKEKLLNYEATKNNPKPPKTQSQISVLKPGETLDIKVMQHFPATLMVADQYGEPLEITYFKAGNKEAMAIEPMTVERQGEEVIDSLNLEALAPYRSASLTLRVKEHRLPINLTVSTLPAAEESEITLMQELRLSWISKLSNLKVASGRHLAPDITQKSDRLMLDMVAGVLRANPDQGLHEVEINGPLDAALFADEIDGYWYLRLPIAARPSNISIDRQVQSPLTGFRGYRLKEMPPRIISLVMNGSTYDLTVRTPRHFAWDWE